MYNIYGAQEIDEREGERVKNPFFTLSLLTL
jgi:hypothetical protein